MNVTFLNRILSLIVSAMVLLLITACATNGTQSFTEKSDVITSGNDSFQRYILTPVKGPPVEYFISRPKERAPLVVYLQGSGCMPVFAPTGFGADYASTIFSSTTIARSQPVSVMVINKPYSPRRPPRSGGVAFGCSTEFNEYFSLKNWVEHIQVAYRHARNLPWVDARKTLVIGLSEGATTAAAFAAREEGVTDVAMVGASGPTQFYDFVVNAYASNSDHEKVLAELNKLDSERTSISLAPDNAMKFAWGHPYKRWASFFAESSVENLSKSNARIYLVSGMADTNVPILSTEVLYAELIWKRRQVTIRRIPNANHALMRDGVPINQVENEYERIVRWFLGNLSTP